MRTLWSLVLIVAALASTAHAQRLHADRVAVGSLPPLRPPPAGGAYIDPIFGTKIIRVTDSDNVATGMNIPTRVCQNTYAYWQAFNIDSSRFFIECDAGLGYLFRFSQNNDTVRYDQDLASGQLIALGLEGASWSGSDPNVIYTLGGELNGLPPARQLLYRVDLRVTGPARFSGAAIIKDFTNSPDIPANYQLFQLGKSDDDNWFTFTIRNPNDASFPIEAFVYDRAHDQLVKWARPANFQIDESQISKDHKFVFVAGIPPSCNSDSDCDSPAYCNTNLHSCSARSAFWTVDGTSNNFKIVYSNVRSRLDGHYDLGHSIMVNDDGYRDGVVYRVWNTAWTLLGTATTIFSYFSPPEFLTADHISLRSDDERFAVLSTYVQPYLPYIYPFAQEILLSYLDGSGFIRLANTRSHLASDIPDRAYAAEPKAVVDRLGRYVVYASDLGSPDRVDTFILRLPQPMRALVGPVNDVSSDEVFHLDFSGHLWRRNPAGTWADQGFPLGDSQRRLVEGLSRLSQAWVGDQVWGTGVDGHVYLYYRDGDTWTWFDGGDPGCFAVSAPAIVAAPQPAPGTPRWLGGVVRCQDGSLAVLRYQGHWLWHNVGKPPNGVRLVGEPALTVAGSGDPNATAWSAASNGDVWYFVIDEAAPQWRSTGAVAAGAAIVGSPGAFDAAFERGFFIPDRKGDLWEYGCVPSSGSCSWKKRGRYDCAIADDVAAQVLPGVPGSFNPPTVFGMFRCNDDNEVSWIGRRDNEWVVWAGTRRSQRISQPATGFRNNSLRFYYQTADGHQWRGDSFSDLGQLPR